MRFFIEMPPPLRLCLLSRRHAAIMPPAAIITMPCQFDLFSLSRSSAIAATPYAADDADERRRYDFMPRLPHDAAELPIGRPRGFTYHAVRRIRYLRAAYAHGVFFFFHAPQPLERYFILPMPRA